MPQFRMRIQWQMRRIKRNLIAEKHAQPFADKSVKTFRVAAPADSMMHKYKIRFSSGGFFKQFKRGVNAENRLPDFGASFHLKPVVGMVSGKSLQIQ